MNHVLRRLTLLASASTLQLLGCGSNLDLPAGETASAGTTGGGEVAGETGETGANDGAMTGAASACDALSTRLQAALDEATRAQKIPGATAAVDHAGCGWRGATGVSDIPAKKAALPGDLFHIGSITKTFTAPPLLTLRAEGKVSLDSPVAEYVKGVPRGDTMTVRQLLSHTGGLFDYTECDAFWSAVEADPAHVWKPE